MWHLISIYIVPASLKRTIWDYKNQFCLYDAKLGISIYMLIAVNFTVQVKTKIKESLSCSETPTKHVTSLSQVTRLGY